MKRLIDVEAAAALLRVSVKWIYKRTSAGTIPHVKRGHWLRFDPVELRKWRRKQKASRTLVSRAQSKRMLTPKEAATFLGRSVSWLHKQTMAKAVPFVMLGREIRFRRRELSRWAGKQGLPPWRPRGWSRASRKALSDTLRAKYALT